MKLDHVNPEAIRAESRPIDYDFLPMLADSILDLGILSPIGIGPDMTLYYGAHRLAAAKEIGLERVPVVVLDTVQDRLDYLKVERDENAVRRTVKTTEQAELYREILELEQAAARQRMSDGGKGEKVSHPSDEDREVRVSVTSKPVRAKDEAARAATGHPGRAKTLDKVLAVMDAAADESQPQPVATAAREALKEIESTGKVDAAHKAVRAAVTAAELVEQFPDLTFYFEQGDHKKVVSLGMALRSFKDPELSMRLNNLRLTVEAEQRGAGATVTEQSDDLAHADAIFVAFNEALKTFEKNGGFEAVRHALHQANPLSIEMWRGTFGRAANVASKLHEETTPKLRIVK